MARISYSSTSPYALTPQTDFAIGLYVDRPIPADPSDRLIQIDPRYQFRPDNLANDLWGQPGWYWVFQQRNINLIRDPIWDLVPGLQIMVPTKERLDKLLASR
jgi:hypothetical protein